MPELVFEMELLDLQDPFASRAVAIDLAGAMLFPRKKDLKKFLHYKAVYLLESISFLVDTVGYSPEAAGAFFIKKATDSFNGWNNYMAAVLGTRIPQHGKGAPESIARHGYIAGALFREIYFNEVSLKGAIKTFTKDKTSSEIWTSEKNIMNNIWPAYKPVAHIWAAMLSFEMPEPDGRYFAIDKATVCAEEKDIVPEGISGVLQLAKMFYDGAAEKGIVFKNTHRPLVDPETAWKIVLNGL